MGTLYTTLYYDKGKSGLTVLSQEHLKELARRAHRDPRPIEDIKILAWSDQEYPNEVTGKMSPRQIALASERARNIRAYLEDELREQEDIDAYNMARRPNLLAKLLRSEEYEVKEAFESSGVTASKLPDGSVSYTKASRALVIIDYEGDEDDLR